MCEKGYWQNLEKNECTKCSDYCETCSENFYCDKCKLQKYYSKESKLNEKNHDNLEQSRQVSKYGFCICKKTFYLNQKLGECKKCFYLDKICYSKCPTYSYYDEKNKKCIKYDFTKVYGLMVIIITVLILFIVLVSYIYRYKKQISKFIRLKILKTGLNEEEKEEAIQKEIQKQVKEFMTQATKMENELKTQQELEYQNPKGCDKILQVLDETKSNNYQQQFANIKDHLDVMQHIEANNNEQQETNYNYLATNSNVNSHLNLQTQADGVTSMSQLDQQKLNMMQDNFGDQNKQIQEKLNKDKQKFVNKRLGPKEQFKVSYQPQLKVSKTPIKKQQQKYLKFENE